MGEKTHGLTYTPLYKIWSKIKERCYNPNVKQYVNYGGRGIIVCDEWLHNPVAFINWALENGYKNGLEIDRIENNGIYSPGNCRFVTTKQNCRNRRSNILFTHNGKTKNLVEWSEYVGMEYHWLYQRIRDGWEFEKAITTPKMVNKYSFKINGNTF